MAEALTPILPKTRLDAWGEQLPEEKRWEIYNLTKPPSPEEVEGRECSDGRSPGGQSSRPWLRDFERDVKPYLERERIFVPGRTAWYRFLARMRKLERVKLVAEVEGSAETAKDIARVNIDFAKAAEAFKALAVDAAMSGDDQTAQTYARAAAAFRDQDLKSRELSLKEERQKTAEKQLALAREKFEFDAAKAAMAKAAEIKSISADDSLAADEKIAKVRAALFGVGAERQD